MCYNYTSTRGKERTNAQPDRGMQFIADLVACGVGDAAEFRLVPLNAYGVEDSALHIAQGLIGVASGHLFITLRRPIGYMCNFDDKTQTLKATRRE